MKANLRAINKRIKEVQSGNLSQDDNGRWWWSRKNNSPAQTLIITLDKDTADKLPPNTVLTDGIHKAEIRGARFLLNYGVTPTDSK